MNERLQPAIYPATAASPKIPVRGGSVWDFGDAVGVFTAHVHVAQALSARASIWRLSANRRKDGGLTDVRSFTDLAHRIMNFRQGDLKPVGPTTLAGQPDFVLGALSISPSRLQVCAGARREAIQPRVMQVLVTLARAKDAVVSRDELIRQCWGGRIVGEDAISRCIAKVRDIADLTGAPAFKIETIPRVGYRLEAEDREMTQSPAAADQAVLAVLAFDNLSGDADMVYFSDGVSEEILQTVARGALLKVIGRGSSFQFRGVDKAAAHVAKVLKATHVLDGSVRRSGNNVRISASLIECAGETTLWSQRFDRELSDVFALQDEIASAVAAALKVALLPAPPRGAIDPAAYDLYLKALEIRNQGLLEPAQRLAVIALLEKATALAPAFARAWALLAWMQAGYLRFDAREQPRNITRAKAVAAAEAALRLDPGLGGAYQALAYLEPFANFAERERLHQKAVSVSPNDPTVLTNASLFLTEIGRIREALALSERAYQFDPMNPWAANWYANMLDYTGALEESGALWKALHARWPDNRLIARDLVGTAAARCDWGWFDELVADAEKRKFDLSTSRTYIAFGNALRDAGPTVRASAIEEVQDTLRQADTLPLVTLIVWYRLGLKDEVFELVDRVSFGFMFDPEGRSPNGSVTGGMIFAVNYNQPMMRDVRFVRLCAKLGLCDYWMKTDRWPDCAEAVARYYNFKAEVRRCAQNSPAADS